MDWIDNVFTHHPPHGNQVERYQAIRGQGHAIAGVIQELTPICEERDIALRKIREAVMWANAAIACNEQEPETSQIYNPSKMMKRQP